jgi:hypothetical protein
MAAMMDDDELQRLYAWVDEIPLSRPKRNIARDFADGVLAAEVCHHYFPRLVDLHNYPPANSMRQKLYNWDTLNARVLRKLDAALPRADVEAVCQCAPGAVERVLNSLQLKMARHRAVQQRRKEVAETAEPPAAPPPARAQAALQADVDQELLVEKEQEVHDLRETVDILEQKIAKLEQLVRLKDAKIQKLKDAAAGRR